jgi:glycerol-3-phosphate acyltransferase PlsY
MFSGLAFSFPEALGAFVFGYLLGSIPFGLILTRTAGTTDIRSIGSGNIGATNVLRTGHKGLAAATLLFDILKGTAAVLVTDHFGGRELAMVAALAVFLGHLFPVWLKFKGGKGVATYIGILLGFHWLAVAVFAVIWLTIAAVTRYSSLAALIATAAMPFVLQWMGDSALARLFGVLTLLVFIMHRANIARLFKGTEGKIGNKADAAPST